MKLICVVVQTYNSIPDFQYSRFINIVRPQKVKLQSSPSYDRVRSSARYHHYGRGYDDNRSICCLRRFSHYAYEMMHRNTREARTQTRTLARPPCARVYTHTDTDARMSSACVRVGYCAFRLENTHGHAAILRARLSKSIRGLHISSEGSDCGKIEDPIQQLGCATNPKIMEKVRICSRDTTNLYIYILLLLSNFYWKYASSVFKRRL